MRYRRRIALGVALALCSCAAPAGVIAAPVQVRLRVEGAHATLYEGPIGTEPKAIEASSDHESHECDGLPSSRYTQPGATPTTALVDWLDSVNETFDGRWEAGYGDYLIQDIAGEREAGGSSWWVALNGKPLDRGGCHYQVAEGAEVLWWFGRSAGEKELLLLPAGSGEALPPASLTAQLGKPLSVEVLARAGGEGQPPAQPTLTGASPEEGARVLPAEVSPDGAVALEEDGESWTTDAQGTAQVVFSTPGWHAIKAIAAGDVRSNRLEVCVAPAGASGCSEAPTGNGPGASSGGSSDGSSFSTTGGQSSGGGAGTGANGAAGGTDGTHTGASPRRGPGSDSSAAASRLQVAGFTVEALRAMSSALHRSGPWSQTRLGGALVMLARAGAAAGAVFGAGRPAFVLRGAGSSARLALRCGGRTLTRTLHRLAPGTARVLLCPSRARRGSVLMRVLAGRVALEALGLLAGRR